MKITNLPERRCLWMASLGLALLVSACGGPTEQDRDNRRLLDAILTAITIKNPRLLEDNAKRAKQRHEAGQLTDEQYGGMEAILNKARQGDWAGAEKDGYDFRKKHAFVKEGR
ncbi:MAG TPA: hypothetical protein VH575_35285 [Gemmataceae bacterium]